MNEKSALIVVLSNVQSDPRVRRQISWLSTSGWKVDTIGLGPLPSADVRDHFELNDQAPWVRTPMGAVLIYGLLPVRSIFRRVASNRIPAEGRSRLAAGGYDLVVLNDTDFAPLIEDPRIFTPAAANTHVHLDIHEYREPRLRARTLWRVLTDRYYRWQRGLIGSTTVDTRSTVARRIAELYAEEFGIERPALVRNSPPFEDLEPTPSSPKSVRLVFHGLASRSRGIDQILDAMRILDDRFTMTFMLTGPESNIAWIRDSAADLGDRVRFVPPVPMVEISTAINAFDLEIMFYPPTHINVEFALPNKFFEAIQGRLGVVVGESPMMAEIVRKHSIGVIVDGWTGEDLARSLSALSAEEIMRFKENSNMAARVLNAEGEGDVFLSTIRSASTSNK